MRHLSAFGASTAAAASLWLCGCGVDSIAGVTGQDGSASGSGADAHLDALVDVAPPPGYEGGYRDSGDGGDGSDGSDGSDPGADAQPPLPFGYDGRPVPCGTQPSAPLCDLKTQTCCFDSALTGTCVSHGAACPAQTASFSCLGKVDCANDGGVCCGVVSAATLVATTACQAVAPGACPPMQASAAQLCVTSTECAAGVQCIAQTCAQGSNFKLCGLQSAAPFNCKAH